MNIVETLRWSSLIAGLLILPLSCIFAYQVCVGFSVNRLIAMVATSAWFPLSALVAIGMGNMLLPSFPKLGFFLTLGYGSLLNWALCYAFQYGAEAWHLRWKIGVLRRYGLVLDSQSKIEANNPQSTDSKVDAPADTERFFW